MVIIPKTYWLRDYKCKILHYFNITTCSHYKMDSIMPLIWKIEFDCSSYYSHSTNVRKLYASWYTNVLSWLAIHGSLMSFDTQQIELCYSTSIITWRYQLQSSVVIRRSDAVRYRITDCRNCSTISIRRWIHKIQPIARPNRQVMEYILWILLRKLIAL